ncbi:S-layer homology domain-containing protein, partial [Pseudoflavonifractor phocaeensis]|nr:S-layer homology domain-containing protein [Pseudoflavonifractor phocaeensis]
MVGSFTDVRTNNWFAGAVEYVVNNGLFSGVSDTSFAPNEPVTRGMLVTVLWRAAGEPSASASAFADVPADAWYARAVAWANANGIVQGYDASTFAPDDRITREQLAAIFQRYAGFKGMETSGRGDLSQFGDTGALSNWAQEGVSWAVGA